MNITIENWGPIKSCKYDLNKSMIITYGENNIGKSYAMQVLYLVLKNLIQYSKDRTPIAYYRRRYHRYITPNSLEEKLLSFSLAGHTERDITVDMKLIFAECMTADFLPNLEDALERTFGTYNLIKENKPIIEIELDNAWSLQINLQKSQIVFNGNVKKIILKKTESEFHKSRECKDKFNVYVFQNKLDAPLQILTDKLLDFDRILAQEILSQVQDVYFLPASRSGIYAGMSSFGPILAELSQRRANIRRTIQIPCLSDPISDYFLELSNIRPEPSNVFKDTVDKIELDILNGKVSFNKKTKNIAYYSEDMKTEMDLKDVSSMVAELVPVTAFFKYIIGKNINRFNRSKEKHACDVVFIEEPEAHLHPLNQVKLIKIFTELIKKPVKLIMASHSNYIFNELNNLIIAGELSVTQYEPILMRANQLGTVSEVMPMDEFGVDDNNFSDIAEEIYEERENLVNRYIQESMKKKDDTTDCK